VRILVTGGAGFIGNNFVRLLLAERADWDVVNLDALTYAGNLESLEEVLDHPKHLFVKGDIANRAWVEETGETFDAVVNFAAESHVDRSIISADDFIRTNVGGTQNMLDWARGAGIGRFVQVSTDEVYGSLGPVGKFREDTPLAPNSPYSASKASADLLGRAAFKTHGQEVVTTRCSNNYGPFQFPDKFIPLMIVNALEEKELPVYGDGRYIRDWIHVDDHCRGVLAALEKGRPGEVYNFGADAELENIELLKTLLGILQKPESLIRFVKDRPGHDRRYAIDSGKAHDELGWAPQVTFEEGLDATVRWYLDHPEWCDRVRSGAYLAYYDTQYGDR